MRLTAEHSHFKEENECSCFRVKNERSCLRAEMEGIAFPTLDSTTDKIIALCSGWSHC